MIALLTKRQNKVIHCWKAREMITCVDDDFANSNAEDASDAPVLKDEDEDDTTDSQAKKSMDRDDSSSELDPHAKASLEAMKQRNTRKKQEAVDKKKAEALLKRPAGLKHAVLKKPAGLKHALLDKHKVEKKCITKPTKSIDKPKCTHSRVPKILPTGWKTDRKYIMMAEAPRSMCLQTGAVSTDGVMYKHMRRLANDLALATTL